MKLRTERVSILGARLMGAPLDLALHEPAKTALGEVIAGCDWATVDWKPQPGAQERFLRSAGDGSNG